MVLRGRVRDKLDENGGWDRMRIVVEASFFLPWPLLLLLVLPFPRVRLEVGVGALGAAFAALTTFLSEVFGVKGLVGTGVLALGMK